jgi:membrane dipeptidase
VNVDAAVALGASRAASELLADADFIDLHLDLDVPVRVLGYSPHTQHGPWTRVVPFMGHTDFPRLKQAGFTGVAYDVATNVFRPERNRLQATLRNVARIEAMARDTEGLALVRTHGDYVAARRDGDLAIWITLQGGNAISADPGLLDGPLGRSIHRITLVHLTSSVLGGSNSPSQPDHGITDRGRAFVATCNDNHVLVDLAHAGRKTFWGALEVHTPDLPPVVTHTGLDGAHAHWRNIDDDQARAIADRGGVVGVIYNGAFLTDVMVGRSCLREHILLHLEHLIDVAGEDAAAIGTDYDGMITPPRDLVDVTHHPLLIDDMLRRGWSETRIRKVLGGNYLRVVEAVRP